MPDIGQVCLSCFHRELLILVGTENLYKSYGNKMMFMAPAVRDVHKWGATHDLITIMYFTDGYNAAEQEAFESALKDSAAVKDTFIQIKKIATITEVYQHINSKDYKNELDQVCAIKKVQRLHIYAHGDPEGIHFGYKFKKANPKGNQSMTQDNVAIADTSGFSPSAQVWSYACRTGAGIDKEIFNSVSAAKPEDSLAQKMADTWQVKKVYAWYTRTYYRDIWSDGGDSRFQKDYIEIDDNNTDDASLWSTFKDWIKDKDGKVLWNPQGAYQGIKGGSTPKGLPNTPQLFSPKE